MTVNERVSEHRRRMRERGLRPVQIWVPDVRTPEFAAQAHRESLLLAQSDPDGREQDFVDSISALWDVEE